MRKYSMEKNRIFILLLAALLIISAFPVSAFETRSGEKIIIDEPIDDDLLVSCDSLTINAPIKSLTFAGGRLTVNEPIKGNLIAAGGVLDIKALVDGDAIVAGGTIDLNNEITGKILATGGSITINGSAENLAACGGMVTIGKNAVIRKDAYLSSSGYQSDGVIKGELKLSEEKESEMSGVSDMINEIEALFQMFHILMLIGLLILGLILMYLLSGPTAKIAATGSEEILLSVIAGIVIFFGSIILAIIFTVTIIGLPIALFIMLIFGILFLLSSIAAGNAFGKWLFEKIGKADMNKYAIFICGFIILQILVMIPIVGFIIGFLITLFGMGTIGLTAYRSNEQCSCGCSN